MKTPFRLLVIAALVPALGGCAKVQAKAAFKDGNKDYKEENYKKAIPNYEKAVRLDPSMAEAWFYLGSSHQALYRPGKEGDENKEHLDKAIECYKKSLELNKADDERLKKVKMNTLAALTAIYSDEPYRSFEEHLATIDRYTTTMADQLHAEGRRARLLDMVWRPPLRFLGFYVLRGGFLDGWRGLLLAYLAAHYVRLKYAKLWLRSRA